MKPAYLERPVRQLERIPYRFTLNFAKKPPNKEAVDVVTVC